jgi:hypothetical protein
MNNILRVATVLGCVATFGTGSTTTAHACIVGGVSLNRTPAVASSGWIGKASISAAGREIAIEGQQEQDILDLVADGQDFEGVLSEELLKLVSNRTGCAGAAGPKYGGGRDNGIDFTVDDRGNTQKVVVYEVKQWTDYWSYEDGFQLSSSSAGYQLSDAWIRNALAKTSDNRKVTIQNAMTYRTLVKAGAAVERDCGWVYCDYPRFMIFPMTVN